MLFLPFWELKDLENILVFYNESLPKAMGGQPGQPDMTKDVLKDRYYVLGGIPRKIFDSKSIAKWKVELASQMKERSRDIQSRLSLNVVKDYNKAHNDLVRIHSWAPRFDEARLFLASDYVRDTFKEIAASTDRRVLADEIKAAWNDPSRSAEAGIKFEKLAFESLILGGRYPLLRIRADGSHEATGNDLQIGPFETTQTFVKSTDLEEIRSNVLYRPLAKNFPIVDYFGLYNDVLMLFQMTVSELKPNPSEIFTKEGVRPILELYSGKSPNGRAMVVFVVPDFVLSEFKLIKMEWTKRKKKEAGKKAQKSKAKVQPPPFFTFADPQQKIKCQCEASVLYLPVLSVPKT